MAKRRRYSISDEREEAVEIVDALVDMSLVIWL